MTRDFAKDVLKCLFLMVSSFAVMMLAALLVETEHTMHRLRQVPTELVAVIDKQAGYARVEGIQRMDRLLREVHDAREDARNQIEAGRGDTRKIAEAYRATLDAQLTETNATISALAKLPIPAVDKLNSVLSQADAGLPNYLDCTSGNCLYNHIQGTAAAVEKASQAVAKAMPEIAANTTRATAGVADTSENTARLTRWCWGRLVGRACKVSTKGN